MKGAGLQKGNRGSWEEADVGKVRQDLHDQKARQEEGKEGPSFHRLRLGPYFLSRRPQIELDRPVRAVLKAVGTDPATLVILQEEGVPEHGASIGLSPLKTLMRFALIDTHICIGSHLKNGRHSVHSAHITEGAEVPTPHFSFENDAEDDSPQRD